jgi:hypothetical protein
VYEAISMDMLIEISPEDIENFHRYLRTIPFLDDDLVPSVLGRQLATEGDVRMFFLTAAPFLLYGLWHSPWYGPYASQIWC